MRFSDILDIPCISCDKRIILYITNILKNKLIHQSTQGPWDCTCNAYFLWNILHFHYNFTRSLSELMFVLFILTTDLTVNKLVFIWYPYKYCIIITNNKSCYNTKILFEKIKFINIPMSYINLYTYYNPIYLCQSQN